MNVFTFIDIVAFSCSTAFIVVLIFVLLAQWYNPRGGGIVDSHIWVNPTTGKKIGDATQKQAYISRYGEAGWKTNIEKQRKALVNSGVLLSLGVYALASYMHFQSEYFELDNIYFPLIIGGVINFLMYFFIARYDLDDVSDSSLVSDRTDLKYQIFILIIAITMCVSVVLLQIFFWLRAYWASSLELPYIIVFSIFSLGLTFLGYRKVNPYERKPIPEKSEEPISKAEAIPFLIEYLKKQTEFANKELLSKKLTELTGEDFGHDASAWERWWGIKE